MENETEKVKKKRRLKNEKQKKSGLNPESVTPTAVATIPVEQKPSSKIFWNDEEVKNTYLETFKFKQFARNYVLTNGDPVEAFRKTFGDEESKRNIVVAANSILQKPEVQLEIADLLPSDQELNEVIRSAINAPTPGIISWSEKHKFTETALKLKGRFPEEGGGGRTTNNVIMFVKE